MSQIIERGATVQLHYTLRDDAGAVIDSNADAAPFRYVHGERQIIPGLESALGGRRAGETVQVTVSCEDAYGVADPEAVLEIPRDQVPTEGQVEGTELTARTRDGDTRLVRVKEVRDESILLDLNHPLAGKTLHFDVRIVDVAPPAS